jgi:hypothetical protein
MGAMLEQQRIPRVGLYRVVVTVSLLIWAAVSSAAPATTPEVAANPARSTTEDHKSYDDGSCVVLTGQAIPGGLMWAQTLPTATIRLNGVVVPLVSDGRFMIGFGRDATGVQRLSIQTEALCEQDIFLQTRDYRIQRVEGVPQRTVTPPEEDLARIRAERALVAAAKAQRFLRPDLFDAAIAAFSWPVQGPISGVYGSQRFYNGSPGNPHYGVDIAVPTGTLVQAPAPGVVTLAEQDLYYSGGTVILDHGYGLSSSFLHMSAIHVSVGDELAVGDVLGEVGATGRATGPHLDWRMNWLSDRVDPQLLVPPMPSTP